uniref:Uncharacterized protein n=1 Tax=Sinocyclocheilus anshuiensis TaxID=1608454 RepID=A0A671RUT4_9TELE
TSWTACCSHSRSRAEPSEAHCRRRSQTCCWKCLRCLSLKQETSECLPKETPLTGTY